MSTMDYHNYMLGLFESFQKHQDQLDARNLLKLNMPENITYVLTAFNGTDEQWYEYAYDQDELDVLKRDAEACGCTFTVEEVE